MDATGQIFQISKFPNTLLFAIIPKIYLGKFDENWLNLYTLQIPKKYRGDLVQKYFLKANH